ncbi:aldo/keto reductase [Sphingomonas sp. Leaf412]|uniref:aldo/keto reductase n=1 Tax=Sphingomonas sp. Leaf412 TaxID=1736370 RepID=UPI0006F48C88|nr:aldo/keto reductase [Sphingomonas sp. Leaf412]KQT35284.1 aldo/keto reductase [Sphingomonas sp. Leaf412]
MTTLRLSSEPRPLGKSGLSVSPLAWGMWRLSGDDVAATRGLIDAALGAGITLFDTADIYGCDTPAGFGSAEALFGRALAEDRALRDAMTIATKGGIRPGIPYSSATAYLEGALDDSLRRMGIDTVDLYQIHRRDFLTHPQEVARALDAMVAAGKVRAVGVSNHSVAEFEAVQAFLDRPIASTQPEFSPLRPDPLFDGTLDHAMRHDVAVLAWSPLGGGRLAGGDHPAARLLAEHGAAYGVDGPTAALSWIMTHPARIIPIVGSQNPARLAAAAGAVTVEWTRPQWYAVLEVGMGAKLP